MVVLPLMLMLLRQLHRSFEGRCWAALLLHYLAALTALVLRLLQQARSGSDRRTLSLCS